MREMMGKGIFGWEGNERRSNRYGAIHLAHQPFDGSAQTELVHNQQIMDSLSGKRVRLTAKVIESRPSSHVGDWFLKIKPSQPDVGEEVDLGVGVLSIDPGYGGEPEYVLHPADGRRVFWLDPRKMYRLHDQTVEIYVEETSAPFSPAPEFRASSEASAFDNGDGSFQLKNVGTEETCKVLPHIDNLGDGMFRLTHQPGAGVRMRVLKP